LQWIACKISLDAVTFDSLNALLRQIKAIVKYSLLLEATGYQLFVDFAVTNPKVQLFECGLLVIVLYESYGGTCYLQLIQIILVHQSLNIVCNAHIFHHTIKLIAAETHCWQIFIFFPDNFGQATPPGTLCSL
jgi:hypothetical protein